MLETIPYYVSLSFILTTILTYWLFFKVIKWPNYFKWILLAWLLIQGAVGYSGFYTFTDSIPPRFLLLVVPMLLTAVFLVFIPPFNRHMENVDLKKLTLIHLVRVPVELVLLWLYYAGSIPELMTFEGRNFDILAGLTTPLIFYWGFTNEGPRKGILLAWNLICFGLLLNIIGNAVLSAPFPFQQFAFEQPNIGLLYFPFIWLPGFVAPAVFFAHLASLKILLSKK